MQLKSLTKIIRNFLVFLGRTHLLLVKAKTLFLNYFYEVFSILNDLKFGMVNEII